MKLVSINPSNKEILGEVEETTKEEIIDKINLAYSAPYNPFGGVKKSGLGRTRGKWGLRGLCNIKVVTFEK